MGDDIRRRTVELEIVWRETSNGLEPASIAQGQPSMLQGEQLVSSETLQDSVDVHGSEAQRVGQVGLGQAEPDRVVFGHADRPLAKDEFAQGIGDTTACA